MNIIRKYKNELILLISVIVIFCSYLYISNIYPFGTNNIYFRDLKEQYFYYIYNFKYRILNHLSLKYTFNTGLGLPFYKLFFTYLSCPVMLLCVLFKSIDSFIFFYILFFLCLASLSMYSYFKYKYKNNNIFYLLIALSYAFSGWIFSYYEHIQWLPVIALLPLLIKYLEILINENKTLGYFIILVLCILSNYYISMFVCLFVTLYYFIYSLINKKLIIKKLLLFSITSLLAAGLLSILLIPFVNDAALSTSSQNHVFYTDIDFYNASLIEYLYRLFSYSLIDRVSNTIKGPNISVSVFILILVLNYFLNKKSNYKNRVLYLSLLIIYFIPFISTEFNYMFNFMHFGNGGFFRYSFIFIFVLCLIAGDSVSSFDFDKSKNFIISIFLINIIILVYLFYENATLNFLIINVSLVIIYMLLISSHNKKILKYLLVLVLIIELVLSFNLNKISSNNSYLNFNTNNDYRSEIKLDGIKVDNSLFNNSLLNNRYSLSSYSSLMYTSVYDFVKKIGIYTYDNFIYYTNDLSFYNLIFNIKYVYKDNQVNENNNAIGYMFMKSENDDIELSDNNIENQNIIFEELTGISNLYKKIKYKKKIVNISDEGYTTVKYIFNKKSDIYYYFDDINIMSFSDGNNTKGTLIHDDSLDVDLNISKTNEVYVVYSEFNDDTKDGSFYIFDEKKFNEGLNYLLIKRINIDEFKEDYIKGNCYIETKESVYTSIPYDDGWSVYVNGKRIDTYKYKNTFLMFDLEEGNNTIELKYSINHFKEGLILSIVSLIMYGLLYYFVDRKEI